MKRDYVPERWNWTKLRDALSRGTRLCSRHPPSGQGRIDMSWSACILRLPESLELFTTFEDDSKRPEFHGLDYGYRRRAGHMGLTIEPSEEGQNFLESLKYNDPESYLQPVEMAFVRLDIAKFTDIPEVLQPRVIGEVHELVVDSLENSGLPRPGEEHAGWVVYRALHTGDGFILPFLVPQDSDPYPFPIVYAQKIARALDLANSERFEVHFRISVTIGGTYVLGDLDGKRNYAGSAINECERLLSGIPKNLDDVVCISYGIYRRFLKRMSEFKFFRFGSVTDKHRKAHRLYLLEYNS